MISFFKIGNVYKTIVKPSFFRSVPWCDSEHSIRIIEETIFTIVDINFRSMDVRDTALYNSPHDISGNVYVIKLIFDSKVCYLPFHENSNLGIRPDSFFREIKILS